MKRRCFCLHDAGEHTHFGSTSQCSRCSCDRWRLLLAGFLLRQRSVDAVLIHREMTAAMAAKIVLDGNGIPRVVSRGSGLDGRR